MATAYKWTRMIIFRCDRCGAETTPEKFYEAELIFTPHDLDGGEDLDKEDRKWLGQLCAACTDVIEPQVQALVKAAIGTGETIPGVKEAGTDER